ncbi:Rho guanine nucleotide exchange factor scd1 [Apiospora aurea]|uniref:Rho guanine nucleotide exchange factor scd1 n=1 Tax=Apiospora aurea TaxID=335848 RepID=A0ABR1Q7E5_9PEZI
MSAPRQSQLSGSTFTTGSSASLTSMGSASTVVGGGPVMATANIINEKADASRSLYQICVQLKQRLTQVPGFEVHLNQLNELSTTGENGGPVESLWQLLRTGYPLLAIYNSLQPAEPLVVKDTEGSEAKRSKLAVFRFVKVCLEKLEIPNSECFVINDLLGNDTTGFVKVTSVLNKVLDEAEAKGLLRQAEQPISEDNASGAAGGSTMTYRDHIIKEMVDTERKYVQDLENLYGLKKALEQRGVIPGDTVHSIFLNINAILDFQRRFLIRVETANSMSQEAQQWGAPFVMYEEGFSIYQPFIANQRKAAQVASQVFDKIQLVQNPVAIDFNTLDGFLLKPMQRLVKYPLLLKDLLKKSEDAETKKDLTLGIAAAERVLSKANEAVDRDLLDEALEDLIVRVDDWKNHRVDSFGRLLLHGMYSVVTGRNDQEKFVRVTQRSSISACENTNRMQYEIYLFECILLCCKEVVPNKTKEKKDKTKSAIPKVRNKNNKLQLKGRIFMTNVTEVLSFAGKGSYTVQIWWKGDPGVENFVIKFSNEEIMKKWAVGLDQQRKDNAPSATSPDQAAPSFTWMRNAEQLENPYAQQGESDDDEEAAQQQAPTSAPNLSFGSQQHSTGGVMTRNASHSSLRSRSATGESAMSLSTMVRAPPPQYALPRIPPPLDTRMPPPSAGSPGPRPGESYFSPTTDSPASTRTSTTGSMQFSAGAYPFPKSGTPMGWEDNNRYTAPAMPRAPSRDGPSPMNGRNPRGPSLPAMASNTAQSLAAQQRSRSYSTPDINGPQNQSRRTNSSTPVPAVPGIPAHLHENNIPRSQTGSPMQQDLPMRSSTQSPGVQRERMHQSNGSYGGKMSQFPSQPLYPRGSTPGPGPGPGQQRGENAPAPLQLDNRSAVSPALGTATPGSALFSPGDVPTQLKVKVLYDTGTYITLVVAFNITYQSMIDRIDAKLSRFTNSSIGRGNLKLRYRDEDGDFVNIESDEDIQIAFMEFRDGMRNQYNPSGVGEIELFCVGDSS